jgi:hypothetical protein
MVMIPTTTTATLKMTLICVDEDFNGLSWRIADGREPKASSVGSQLGYVGRLLRG